MKVSVIGTGYVGLVSGVCLAEKGHEVLCVDVDEQKISLINHAIPPIYEHGLEALLQKQIGVRLEATTDLHHAVLATDLSIIAVGTPFQGSAIDLKYIEHVSRQIGEALRHKATYHVVLVKSTVVPGTTDDVVRPILEAASGKTAGLDFGLGMNPEFLREGEAIHDFLCPDRIVLGGIDAKTLDVLEDLYAVFPGVDKLRTTPKTAEMVKYAANSLLATMISFSNEIGNLCTALEGIDVVEVMRGVHLDKRLSPILPSMDRIVPPFTTYLEAGCGFGGSCFPKDVKALIAHGKTLGQPMQLLDAVIQVNERQPQQILALLQKYFRSLRGVRIAVLGLAFKPNTDDIRESPAIPIVQELIAQKAQVKVYDPVVKDEAQQMFGQHHVVYCDALMQALEDVEAVALLTSWDEFQRLPELLNSLEPQPIVIDGRRMLNKHSIARYDGIGL
jgi:UDPglucose 6-dehydrogenase/GDP-mannose 6-dehydrogenase